MLTERELEPWLPAPGTAAVCAVSGGLDSMCLLYLLWRWCGARGIPLTAAHFHHGLRSAADRDEAFVRDWCTVRGIRFTAGHGDARAYAVQHGASMEEAARELRYAFLRETAAQFRESLSPEAWETEKRDPETRGPETQNSESRGPETRNSESRSAETQDPEIRGPETLIYTAHHAGDDAETVLLNLIRGTGLRGLGGMPRRRDGIVRPLLDITRRELEEYAADHGIGHVEDETNADPDAATRNRVRLELLPLLRELNPRAEEHLRQTARQVREAETYLEEEGRRWYERAVLENSAGEADGVTRGGMDRKADRGTPKGTDGNGEASPKIVLDRNTLRDAPSCLRPRLLLLALDALGVGRKDFGAVHLDAVLALLSQQDGQTRRLDLPHGVTVRCDADTLTLERRPPLVRETDLLPGLPVLWGAYRLTRLSASDGGAAPLDNSRQGALLVLRDGLGRLTVARLRAGDRLRLPGESGSRTVKRLCLDRRIPPEERDRLPAVYADGRLAAVWPLGTDADFLPVSGDGARTAGEVWILVEKLPGGD